MTLSGRNSEHTLMVLEEIYQQAAADTGSPSARRKARWQRFSMAAAAAPLTVAVGVFALALGFWQLRASLRLPVARLRQQPPPQLSDFTAFNPAALAIGQVTDTDGDGLSDQEESRVGTSAFLEDSDSDGRLDRDEVTAGTDPTCPEGQTCRAETTSVQAAPTPTAAAPAFDATAVRDQLRKAGLSEDLLAGFSNAQLEEVYREVVSEGAAGNPATAGPAVPPIANLVPSANELRQLLLQQGMPKEQLDRLSDEQLQKLFQETIRDNVNGQ